MRLPFNFNDSGFDENARIKFSFTSPELHQNIEISIDGDKTSLETLLDTFERFLGALGVSIPENVVLSFIDISQEEGGEDEDEGEDNKFGSKGTTKFTLEDDEPEEDEQ